ncbi:G protein-coupled receptor protein [Turkeypox virus]|uniref:G protein-coupled receptor protein n=1 Tax=Turkeypox virus TaxID=336486 RepID=A0A0M3ZHE1_9POXV|nr:G protein-coupled receptor protein [Turkeypox virus]ALA62385.1 G protein-coupled receptor protein [Turkeypox virus]
MTEYNITVVHDRPYLSINTRIILTVLYFSVFFAGIIGNSIVIWFTGCKWRKTTSSIIFLNIAIADLLFVLFIPLYVVYIITNFHWPFGLVLCKLSSFVFTTGMFASIFLLTYMSIDRCLQVSRPLLMAKYRNIKNMLIIIYTIWISAFLLGIPVLYYRTVITVNKYNSKCINYFHHNKNVHIMLYKTIVCVRLLLGYIIPGFIMIVSYTILINKAKSIYAISNKTFFITVSSVISFLVFWTPYHIFSLASLDTGKHNLLQEAIPVSLGIAFIYSCINPIIYILLSRCWTTNLGTISDAFKFVLISDHNTSIEESRGDDDIAEPYSEVEA